MERIGRVDLGDVEIEWERTGSGDRPFVLVHGFTGSRDDWADVLPALAELGPTVTLDLDLSQLSSSNLSHGSSLNPSAALRHIARSAGGLCQPGARTAPRYSSR